MPISPIVLQRRHAELGRIRLGNKGDRGQPQKLSSFRFTSHSERYIRDLAELYGGTPQPWDNKGVSSWEVFTTASSIPVIAVKGGLSQWMETWGAGGCLHRCSGERDVEGNLCDPEDPNHQQAKPTTRLSVMLPELEAVGVFRMETHGWNAAAEIPAVAELAQYVGDLVPAHLHLVERRAIKDGKTSRFVVPVLDLQIGTARLKEIAAQKSGMAELPGSDAEQPKQLGAGDAPAEQPAPPAESSEVRIPTPDQIKEADLPTLRRMQDYLAANVGEHPAAAAVRDRINDLEEDQSSGAGEAAGESASPAPEPQQQPVPDADGAVDAELVEPDADVVWQQILKEAGERGITLADTEDDVTTFLGGTTSAEASGGELTEYLEDLRKRPEGGAA